MGRNRRRGVRPRKINDGVREIRPAEPAILPRSLRQRAEFCGSPEMAADPKAGTPLGALLIRGILDQAQFEAGVRFELDWGKWAMLSGLPPHQARKPTGAGTREATSEECIQARQRYLAACGVLPPGLVWSVVENVVMDGWPQDADQMKTFLSRAKALDALRLGLENLAQHYGMRRRNAA